MIMGLVPLTLLSKAQESVAGVAGVVDEMEVKVGVPRF
jgi:hypothetical protein